MITKVEMKFEVRKESVAQLEGFPISEIVVYPCGLEDARVSDDEPMSISSLTEEEVCPTYGHCFSPSLFHGDSPLQASLGLVSVTTKPKETIGSKVCTSVLYPKNKKEIGNGEIFQDFHSIYSVISLSDGVDLTQHPAHDRCVAPTGQTIKQSTVRMQENKHWQQSMIHNSCRPNISEDFLFAIEPTPLPTSGLFQNRKQGGLAIRGEEKVKVSHALTSRPFEELCKLMERTASSRCMLLQQSDDGNTSSAPLMKSLSASAFKTIVSSSKITSRVSAQSFRNKNDVVPDTSTATTCDLTNCTFNEYTEGFENQTEKRMAPMFLAPTITRTCSMDSLPSCGSMASR